MVTLDELMLHILINGQFPNPKTTSVSCQVHIEWKRGRDDKLMVQYYIPYDVFVIIIEYDLMFQSLQIFGTMPAVLG